MRVSGPYLAMMTIAFAFIVEHGTIEWRELTGGQNGLMGIAQPSLGGRFDGERGLAVLAACSPASRSTCSIASPAGPWGKAMLAVRDSEIAARAIGFNPVLVKTVGLRPLGRAVTGLAGGLFASLMAFVAPSSFPFSQSILFLLAVIVGGAGWTLGPVVGARRHRRAAGADLRPRRVSPAGVRRAAAGRALDRAGWRDRHAGASAPPHR